jgi:hypothetical protein
MTIAALDILLDHGLDKRAPVQFGHLRSRRNVIARDEQTAMSVREDQMQQKVKNSQVSTVRAITSGLVDLVSRRFS